VEYYLEILAFHVIAVMSWMALLFYMPRLFVYHVENKHKKDFTDVIEIQELKIYKIIGFPAMIATILSGIAMIYLNPELLKQGWFHAKLAVLILMILYTLSLERYRKELLAKTCDKNGQYFRAYNEVPTLFAVLVVVFVITKSIPVYFSIGITLFFAFIIYKIMTKKVDNE
jgi:putative membrane protein